MPAAPDTPAPTLGDRLRTRLRRDVAEPLDRELLTPLRRLFNRGRSYRPIFVAGAAGSGTSLLTLSMGQRFECAGVVYESKDRVPPSSPLYVPDIESFADPGAYLEGMRPRETWSVERAREDLLSMYRGASRGPSDVVIDKGPDANLLRARFLARCFPDAGFVLIFRDPVANVEGFRRKWQPFGGAPLEECVTFYRRIHTAFLDAWGALGSRVLAVEYERLVEDLDGELDRVARTLRLRDARRPRRLPHYANVEGRGARNVRGGRIGVVRDASARARARLGADEVRAIEAGLADLHERLRALARDGAAPGAPGAGAQPRGADSSP